MYSRHIIRVIRHTEETHVTSCPPATQHDAYHLKHTHTLPPPPRVVSIKCMRRISIPFRRTAPARHARRRLIHPPLAPRSFSPVPYAVLYTPFVGQTKANTTTLFRLFQEVFVVASYKNAGHNTATATTSGGLHARACTS